MIYFQRSLHELALSTGDENYVDRRYLASAVLGLAEVDLRGGTCESAQKSDPDA
jgi:hypothetical protein